MKKYSYIWILYMEQ